MFIPQKSYDYFQTVLLKKLGKFQQRLQYKLETYSYLI